VADLKALGYVPETNMEKIRWLLASGAEGYPEIDKAFIDALPFADRHLLDIEFRRGVAQAGNLSEKGNEAYGKLVRLLAGQAAVEVIEEPLTVRRQRLVREVETAIGENSRTMVALKSQRPAFNLNSLAGIVSQIMIAPEGVPAVEEVVAALDTLVALKAGELDWTKFLSLARSILANPALAVSEAEGATIIAVSGSPSTEELENALMQLAMNTGQRVRYVLENIDPDRQVQLTAAVRGIQGTLDRAGRPIGRRLEIVFLKQGQKMPDRVKSLALQMGNENAAFKGGRCLTLLVGEGMATRYGPAVGTVMESWKDAGAKFAAVRNLLAMKAAQMNLSTKDAAAVALLNKQIGDNAIVPVPNTYYFGIDGSKLSALAKLWSEVMSLRATSIAA
nr:hypothetical protein [Candidatus Omnitrophota bacterium]